MATIPRLLERSKNFIDLTIRKNVNVRQYIIGAEKTLDAAFTGTTEMFRVREQGSFRSPSIKSRRLGRLQDVNRDLTRIYYDPQDYVGANIPPDTDISFMRVQEVGVNGVVRPEGPILVIPPATLFATPRQNLTLTGTAPAVAGLPNFLPPVGSMHFALPRYSDFLNVHNASANPLFMSFGEGQPEILIPAGETRIFADAIISEIYARGDGGTAQFYLYFAIVNGIFE